MSAGVLQCVGDVTVAPDGAALCSGLWQLVPAPEPFDISLVDPAVMASAFSVGFVLVGSIWFASICFRMLLSTIK